MFKTPAGVNHIWSLTLYAASLRRRGKHIFRFTYRRRPKESPPRFFGKAFKLPDNDLSPWRLACPSASVGGAYEPLLFKLKWFRCLMTAARVRSSAFASFLACLARRSCLAVSRTSLSTGSSSASRSDSDSDSTSDWDDSSVFFGFDCDFCICGSR